MPQAVFVIEEHLGHRHAEYSQRPPAPCDQEVDSPVGELGGAHFRVEGLEGCLQLVRRGHIPQYTLRVGKFQETIEGKGSVLPRIFG